MPAASGGCHLLALPPHIISDLILPEVTLLASVRAFLATCKVAHGLGRSACVQANWLQRRRPGAALYIAARSKRGGGSEDLVLTLLDRPGVFQAAAERGVDRRTGDTLLTSASRAGYARAVRRLLQLGADPNARSAITEHTPLAMAANYGHVAVVEDLLRSEGVDVTGRCGARSCGDTALHVAVHRGHANVVRLLQQAGVSSFIRNAIGFTPRHVACMYGADDVMDELFGARHGCAQL